MSERTAHRPTRTVLLRGGEVHSPADPFATAMVVERGSVAWVGSEGAADSFADGVDEVVDLDGALVTPAFTDAHVHTTATGLALTGLDLSGAPSLADALDRVRDYAAARPGDRVLLGHGWDAARWPERRHPDARRTRRGHRRPPALPHPHRRPLRRRHHRPARPRPRRRRAGRLRRRRTAHPRRPPRRTRRRATAPSPPPSAPRPSGPRSPTPPRSASAPSTSARARRSPARTTSPGCCALAAEEPGPRVVGYWAEPSTSTRRRPRPRPGRRRRRRRPLRRRLARLAHRLPARSRTPTPRTPAPPTWTPTPSPPTSPPAPRPGSRPASTPSATPP